MTSPVSAIEAIEKYIEMRLAAHASECDDPTWPVPHDVQVMRDAKSVVLSLARQAEALTGIGSAHDLISDWLGEGTDDLPDETPVRIDIGKRIIIADNLGLLRRARALLGGSENAE